MTDNRIEISIGLPVFNGERFISQRLDSLLNQTFKNFELIISDNASTDNTERICKRFAEKDPRIKYFRHQKNRGVTWNLNFVLQQAKGDFFLWAAVDDVILPEFLEKCYHKLRVNEGAVACISQIQPTYAINNGDDQSSRRLVNITNTLRETTRPRRVMKINGTHDERIRKYLRHSTCQVIYSLFRKKPLEKASHEPFMGNDWAVFLNVLKYGNLELVDEVLMYEHKIGLTGKGILNSMKNYKQGKLGMLLPWFPFTKWCVTNLGTKLFLKNLDYFIQLNFEGIVSLTLNLFFNAFQKIKSDKV